MAQEITPDRQNVEEVFSNTAYFIDFYQREYKWKPAQVETLLDDVFHKFKVGYQGKEDREANASTAAELPWYYLNTLITNRVGSHVYVVDGQQRLTTLTLVLIKLRRLLRERGLTQRQHWVQQRIVSYSADGLTYWMGQGKRRGAVEALYEERDDFEATDVTYRQMVANFKGISNYLDRELKSDHELELFTLYFVQRLVLVNLQVTQTDVAMVFEVVNDRGLGLNPHEILKGKLLSQIDKAEVEPFVDIWEGAIDPLDEASDADDFFRVFLRAKLPIPRRKITEFDRDYHRIMLEPEYDKVLRLRADVEEVKSFVREDLVYFTALYGTIDRRSERLVPGFEAVRFNAITKMDQQVLLVLAACKLKDPLEDAKLASVAAELDRLYVLLRLSKAYDSRRFTDLLYGIRDRIREQPAEQYRQVFDSVLLDEIRTRRGDDRVDSPYVYRFFKEISHADLDGRFIRYFLARIELFIAAQTAKATQSNMWEMVRADGRSSNCHHIEHILAWNEENVARFGDEEAFERERNRLGALLLLRGRDNQSSGNETYAEKRKTYAGSLYWNQSLCGEFYKSKLDNRAFFERYNLDFEPIDEFDADAIESRTRLLFQMVQAIWA